MEVIVLSKYVLCKLKITIKLGHKEFVFETYVSPALSNTISRIGYALRKLPYFSYEYEENDYVL